jgi:predicted nuclease of predicted toxin-antitoxin system
MKFLANENFPFPSIKILREKGFDVVSISEESSGISDEEVLQKAAQENPVILTFDRDYGELIFKYLKDNPPAVVYFRTKGQTPQEAGKLLIEKIEVEMILLEGFFTVIEATGVRQRRLK